MKSMTKKKFVILFAVFCFVASNNMYAGDLFRAIQRITHSNGGGGSSHGGGGSVGAPIDGGLLTILGAAGIGYFVVRRKNKKAE